MKEELDVKDLIIVTYRQSVRITHIPTGCTALSSKRETADQNRKDCLDFLKVAVPKQIKREQQRKFQYDSQVQEEAFLCYLEGKQKETKCK